MKGIVLAGGKGTRLYPMTRVISKPLLPIYDKPMVYYPLSALMHAGLRDIMVISSPDAVGDYEELLGDGSNFGIHLSYGIQKVERGIADAFIIAEDFIGEDNVCLALGDNLFDGEKIHQLLANLDKNIDGAMVFGCYVENPTAFGVVEFDEDMQVVSLEEKPAKPKSSYAVPGLYFYDNRVVEIAKSLELSDRGELEITAVNNEYLKRNALKVTLMDGATKWTDNGTPEGLLESADYVCDVQKDQDRYVACLEEIAFRKGYITADQLMASGKAMEKTDYGKYLISLAQAAQKK